MSTSRIAARRLVPLVAGALLGAVLAVTVASPVSVRASSDRLRIGFDEHPVGARLAAGARATDVSGHGNHGIVESSGGGAIVTIAGPTGSAADFPGGCGSCPHALLRVGDHASLDPLTADFEWGARILMHPDETADGENVVQKGLWGERGGQWKLQVDKGPGRPSCVVSGRAPGQRADRRVVLLASVGIADGTWHQVTCRRTAAAGVQIFVDGVLRGAAAMPVVRLESAADVTIGAKWAAAGENDQFRGVLDEVFMTVLDPGASNEQSEVALDPSRPPVEALPGGATGVRRAARLGVVAPD